MNGSDNCPNWYNPTQALPAWPVPSGDPDCDGFTDAQESFVGTDPLHACANTATANDEDGADAWPLDYDDSQVIDILDISYFVGAIVSTSPGPPYAARLDYDGNGTVNILDVSWFVGMIGKHCTP